jgi:hypothetical protein
MYVCQLYLFVVNACVLWKKKGRRGVYLFCGE